MQEKWKVNAKAYRDILETKKLDDEMLRQMLYDLNDRLENIEAKDD